MAWTPKRALIALALVGGVIVLYLMGAEKRREEGKDGADPASGDQQCRVVVVADVLNVRAQPTIDAEVVDKLRQDTETDADDAVENGFRKLGDDRWASTDYLEPVAGSDCG